MCFKLRTDMALQLLEHSKKSGEKTYRYYSIAEPYREDGKNKKRILAHLGGLEFGQVEKIRQALRMHNDPGLELIRPEAVECTGSWEFLSLSVFHELWKKSGISRIISSNESDVELSKILEILVLNRITAPVSKSGIVRWYPTTTMPELLGVTSAAINESRIYRSLPGIDSHQEKIEQHLFKTLVSTEKTKPMSLFFYDLTSSYFEGEEVELGAFSGHSKDHRPDKLQVVLGLLINSSGIPFSWDVMKGNQGDAPTLIMQLKKFKKRFGVEKGLLIFDRGFLSHDNLDAVEKAGYHYLTGLRAPQIENILTIYPQNWLSKVNTDNAKEIVAKQENWQRYDETGFYSPLGIINHRKTILLFDSARYKLAVLSRQKRIDDFKQWTSQHNELLTHFKKDAKREAIQNDVNSEIEKRKLAGFVSYELHEYVTENETFQRRKNNPYPSQGYMRKIKSFQIVIRENNHHTLDGVFALITSPDAPLSSEEMVSAYRQKYLIENAFREMKSILKLRPWFVYKMEHVRAHYMICVLAYLLERLLDLALDEHGLKKDGWTLGKLKETLNLYRLVEFRVGEKHVRRTVQTIPSDLAGAIKLLGLQAALKPPNYKS